MPRLDGTGPLGQGPRTGRGLGQCSGQGDLQGRGYGRGRQAPYSPKKSEPQDGAKPEQGNQ